MKHVFSALIVGAVFAAAQAHAACDYPVAPGKFPDGNQATKEEMLAAKGLVVKYNSDMDAYLGCIKTEYDASVASLTKPSKEELGKMEKAQTQKQDAALKEVTDVTERFNEQLRAWKAKNAPAEKKPS
ncbi:MAG TPA: hypothetical protein VFU13_06405 [Steroidobacteraceae bacterium]|nr:hypothetical protein [Steroidobacteraceae bacterium]